MTDPGVADGFQEQTREQRDLYGEENNGERGSVFRNTHQGSLRTTLEHMSSLRDSIDEVEERFSQMSRKTKLTGEAPDSRESDKLRKTVRNTIRTISDVARSRSLTMHTDTIFRKELNRATTTLVDYLKNENTEQTVLNGLDNLREVIDDSFEDKNAQKIIERNSRLSKRVSISQLRQSKMNRQTLMRQSMAKGAPGRDSRRSLLTKKIEKQDINKVVEDFEDIRQIFDEITSKVAARDVRNDTETDDKSLRKSVKGALRNLQGITTHQHLTKIDGGFRTELAETTETMLDYLKDSTDPSKVESMELQMLNVIDNIDKGTTEKESPTKRKSSSQDPSTSGVENNQIRQSTRYQNASSSKQEPDQPDKFKKPRLFKKMGEKVLQQVRVANIFKDPNAQLSSEINNVRDALIHARSTLAKETEQRSVRKSVKQAMRLVKQVVDEKTVEQFSDEFRGEISKTAEGMIDYLTGQEISNTELSDKLKGTVEMLNQAQPDLPSILDVEGSNSTGNLLIDKLLSSEPDLLEDKIEKTEADEKGPIPRMTYDGRGWTEPQTLPEESVTFHASDLNIINRERKTSDPFEPSTSKETKSTNPTSTSTLNSSAAKSTESKSEFIKLQPSTHSLPSKSSVSTNQISSDRPSKKLSKSSEILLDTKLSSTGGESRSINKKENEMAHSSISKESRSTRSTNQSSSASASKLITRKRRSLTNQASEDQSVQGPSDNRQSRRSSRSGESQGNRSIEKRSSRSRTSEYKTRRTRTEEKSKSSTVVEHKEYSELGSTQTVENEVKDIPTELNEPQPIELGKRVSFSDMPSVTFLPNDHSDSDEKSTKKSLVPLKEAAENVDSVDQTSQTDNELVTKATGTDTVQKESVGNQVSKTFNTVTKSTETEVKAAKDNTTETFLDTKSMAVETETNTSTRTTSTNKIETKDQANSPESISDTTQVDPKTRSRVEKRASKRESRRRAHSSPPVTTSSESDQPKSKRARSLLRTSNTEITSEIDSLVTRHYESIMTEMLSLRQTVVEVSQRTIDLTMQLNKLEMSYGAGDRLKPEVKCASTQSTSSVAPSVSTYLIQRNGSQKLIKSLTELKQDDLIICATTQSGESVKLDPHPEIQDHSKRHRATSPAKIIGFGTRHEMTNESGWTQSPSQLELNHVVCGAATRTLIDNGGTVSGWLPAAQHDVESEPGSEVSVNNKVSKKLRRRKRRVN